MFEHLAFLPNRLVARAIGWRQRAGYKLSKLRRYQFQHRRIEGDYAVPLSPGRYVSVCETYDCPRPPKAGETASEYTRFALANGSLIKTASRKIVVEA